MAITHKLAEPLTLQSSFSPDQCNKTIIIRCLGLLNILWHTLYFLKKTNEGIKGRQYKYQC